MDIDKTAVICYNTSQEKGFENSYILSSLVGIVSEIGEAMLELKVSCETDKELYALVKYIDRVTASYKLLRKMKKPEEDITILDMDRFVEEIADIQLRLFAFMGYLVREHNISFNKAIDQKKIKNNNRPEKNGKKW